MWFTECREDKTRGWYSLDLNKVSKKAQEVFWTETGEQQFSLGTMWRWWGIVKTVVWSRSHNSAAPSSRLFPGNSFMNWHPAHSWNPLAVPTKAVLPPSQTSGTSGSGNDGFLSWTAEVVEMIKCTQQKKNSDIRSWSGGWKLVLPETEEFNFHRYPTQIITWPYDSWRRTRENKASSI